MKLRKKASRRRGITLAEMAVALALIMIVSVATTSLYLSVSEKEEEISDTMEHNERMENVIECYQWANGDLGAFYGAMDTLGYLGSVIVSKPTCEGEGYIECTCGECGGALVYLAPIGHVYNKGEVTEPTCTGQGYTTYTCFRCSDSYDDDYVDAPGHSMSDWIVDSEATCTEDGSQHKECANCGHEETETITAPGHDYQVTGNYGEVGHEVKCSRCGDPQTVDHVWEPDPDDDDSDGKQIYKCACGYTKEEDVSPPESGEGQDQTGG